MKNRLSFLIQLFIAVVLVITTVAESYAIPVRVRIVREVTLPGGKGKPVKAPALDPISCIADKEAGWAEIHFMTNLGVVAVDIEDTNGQTVETIVIDTELENHVIIDLPIQDEGEICTLRFSSERFNGYAQII